MLKNNQPAKEVTFVISNQRIKCEHDKLLRYPFFNSMLTKPFQESASQEIKITDISIEAFTEILSFIKQGTVNLSENNVVAILFKANYFIMEDLKALCLRFIENNLTNHRQKHSLDYLITVLEKSHEIDINNLPTLCLEALKNHDYYSWQTTALFEAQKSNSVNAFKFILTKIDHYNYQRLNQSYNMGSNNSRRLLDIAIEKEQLGIIALLLQNPSVEQNYTFYLDKERKSQYTPLGLAASKNNTSIVSLLVQSNKRIDESISSICEALKYALVNKSKEIVEIILKSLKKPETAQEILQPASLRHDDELSLFQQAFDQSLVDIVKVMLAYGADPCRNYISKSKPNNPRGTFLFQDNNEKTTSFIHQAARLNSIHMLIAFIRSKHFKLDLYDKIGNTPLHTALKHKKIEAASLLLVCDSKVTNKKEQNALHYICLLDDYTLVKIFEPLNTKDNEEEFDFAPLYQQKDSDGNLPAHYAMQSGNIDLTKFLIDKGAFDDFIYNDDFFNKQHETPFDLACNQGKQNFVMKTIFYLVEQRAQFNAYLVNHLFYWAAIREYYDIVAYLVKQGANINIRSSKKESFLHRAASKGRLEAVKFLINKGANVNQQNSDQETPLHLAAKNGHAKVIAELLQANANPFLWNSQGKTALQLAKDQNTALSIEPAECKMQ